MTSHTEETVFRDFDNSLKKVGFIRFDDPNSAYEITFELEKKLKKIELHFPLNADSAILERRKAELLYQRGNAAFHSNQLEQAMVCLKSSQEIFTNLNEVERICSTHKVIGNCYGQVSDYTHALDAYKEALRIETEHNIRKQIPMTLHCISEIYYKQNRFEMALELIDQCLESRPAQSDGVDISPYALLSKGVIYREMGQFSRSFRILKTAEELCNAEPTVILSNNILCELGLTESKLGNFERASVLCRKAMDNLSSQTGFEWIMSAISLYLGEIFSAAGNPEASSKIAREWIEKAVHYAEQADNKEWLYKSHLALSQILEMSGDFERALKHFKKYYDIKEEVLTKEAEIRMSLLQVSFNVEKKNREIEIQNIINRELSDSNSRLEELNQEKNELMGIIAHDMKNPLIGIRGMIGQVIAMPDVSGQAEICRKLDLVDEAARNTLEVANNLLDLNKLEQQGFLAEPEFCPVTPVIKGKLVEYDQRIREKSLDLRFEEETHGSDVAYVDPFLFRQVVDNLLSNAIKYSPPGKTIQITKQMDEDEGVMILRFKNVGAGLSSEDREKIFNKFAQLSTRPTAGEASTGLGLAIAKRLVELNNGRISFTSEPGMGVEFTVEFPID